ncbi:MAG: UvrD-helicase domain-containing protein [Symbiobacteriia bacterium]
MSKALPDKQARQRIQTDLGTNFLVEAGAGSGKTTSLVGRMVALVAKDEATVENIAAVTFTRKASAELRQRFQVTLEKEVRNGARPAEERERLAAALGNLDRCFLGTIHSFCSRLLRERPIEAGLDPAFAELEEQEDVALRAQVWAEYLEQLRLSGATAPAGVLAVLDELDVSLGDLQEVYSRLSYFPDVEVFWEPAPRPAFAEARKELTAYLKDVKDLLPGFPPEKGWDGLQVSLRKALQRVRVFGIDEERQLLRVLGLFEKDPAVTLNRWPSNAAGKQAKDRTIEFQGECVIPTLQAWREHRHSRLVDVVMPAVEHYTRRRQELGRLNFEDLLMQSAALLRDNPEVRRYFAQRYTHLLIDEFQDTDPIQAEVMFLLTGTPDTETDWHRVTPRQGSLFVVGDPKQSIYRFRRADIATYNFVKERIQASGGDVLGLTTNFRSTEAIGDWASRVFKGVLPEAGTPYQAAYAPVQAVRPDGETRVVSPEGADDGGLSVGGIRKISIEKVDRNRAQDIVDEDARRIAQWVAWACRGNLTLPRTNDELASGLTSAAQPGDFLILLDRKRHMQAYARALEAAGLPYRVAGAETFADSPEVAELLTLLRAVADPDDPVHLIAALRGLFFGISDDSLYQHRKAGGRFTFLGVPVGADATGEAVGPLADALARLRDYWTWSRQEPPTVALERIIEDLGVLPFAAAGETGNSRAGNIAKALELVRQANRSETSSFADAVDFLAQIIEAGGVEEGSLLADNGRAVALMNLHKAKGLEAPVVFLAGPVIGRPHDPAEHVDRTGATAFGHFLISASRGEFVSEVIAQPPGWAKRSEEEAKYLDAERHRLLYVAATRARDLLVVSRYEGNPEKSPWALYEPFLADAPELEEGCEGVGADGDDASLPDAIDRAADSSAAGAAAVAVGLSGLVGLDRSTFDRELEANTALVTTAAAPGFTRTAVTDLTHTGELPPWQTDGKGPSWGSAVHGMLEAAGRGASDEELDVLAPLILEEEGRTKEESLALLDLVHSVQATELWQRMMRAEERLFEVPLLVEAGLIDSPGPLVNGVVDAAFREPDGWVLVDYKTDSVPEGTLDQFVDYYRGQVNYYKEQWRNLTGQLAASALLCFLSLGQSREV